MSVERSDLNVALERYLGYQTHAWPGAHWDAVVEALGLERAQQVELRMLLVLGDLNDIKPDWDRHSLMQASEAASREIRKRHPDLDGRTGKALLWAYSYGYK